MNECHFTASINKAVAAEGVYVWKISDRFSRGIPDAYYSDQADCWVEYKWAQRLTRSPRLSELQKDWLQAQHQRGRQVGVVVGSPDGCLIYPGISWINPDKTLLPLTRREIIQWILSTVRPATSCFYSNPPASSSALSR